MTATAFSRAVVSGVTGGVARTCGRCCCCSLAFPELALEGSDTLLLGGSLPALRILPILAGVGMVALARYHENANAPDIVKKCIANLDPFYQASILPHDDSGYPEGPLYRNYALLWLLKLPSATPSI